MSLPLIAMYSLLLLAAGRAGLEMYWKNYRRGIVMGLILSLVTAAFGHLLFALVLFGTMLATWAFTVVGGRLRRVQR